MTGTTATQGLTYPTSGDLLRDQGKYIDILANQLETRFNLHDLDLDRSQIPPLALLQLNTPVVVDLSTGSKPVPFDTVVVDTAGMVDLNTDNSTVFMRQKGYWNLGAYVATNGTNCTNGSLLLSGNLVNFSMTLANFGNWVHDGVTGFLAVHSSGDGQLASSTPEGFFVTINAPTGTCPTPNNVTINFACMWAYWTRDL